MVCGILCKCYASLIVAHDECRSFLHVSHIRQKLPKPNHFFCAMISGHVLHLHRRQCNGWLFLGFPWNNSNATKKYVTRDRSLFICISRPMYIVKSSQGNILALVIVAGKNDLSKFEVWSILPAISTIGVIRTLCHFILSRPIWYRHLLLDVMILQKTIECLGNKLPAIFWPKHLDFILCLYLDKCLELLWTSQSTPFWISTHITTLFLKNYQQRLRNTLHHPWMWSAWGHTHRNVRFPKAWSLVFPLHSETRPYINCLQYPVCKATRVWGKQICQGLYHLSCFGAYEHLHVWMAKATVPNSSVTSSVGDCTKLVASARISSQILFHTSCLHMTWSHWLHCRKIL